METQKLPGKDQPSREAPAHKRPFGINAIIALIIIRLIISSLILIGGSAVILNQINSSIISLDFINDPEGAVDFWSLFYRQILIFPILLIIAIGLFRLKHWAWVSMMLLVGIDMLNNLWLYTNKQPMYASMAVDILIVFYLNLHETQQIFNPKPEEQEGVWTT